MGDSQKKKKARGGKDVRSISVSTELALMIAAAILIFACLSGLASDYVFKSILSENLETIVKDADLTAREFVDGDRIDEYMESKGTSKSAQRLQKYMQAICDDSDFNYVYLITVDFEAQEVISILSARGSVRYDLATYEPGQVSTTSSQENWKAFEALMSGEEDYGFVYRLNDSSGARSQSRITGMAAVRDSSGDPVAIMCVEAPFEWYDEALFFYRANLFACVLLVLVLCVTASFIATRRRISLPIKAISKETLRFAYTRTYEQEALANERKRGNELGYLARSVGAMEFEIVDSDANIARMTSEKERLAAELDIASGIQESALPHNFPAFPERTEFDLYASMRPAKEVGGDFYDFFLIDEDHLGLVIADVSGKGVPAALFMMVSKLMIQNYASLLREPSAVLKAVNDKLSENNDASMFVTVWLGVVEISTGLVKAVNAGHENPVLRHAGQEYELLRGKHDFVVGPMGGIEYSQCEIQLEPGDSLLLYTDGLPDAKNSEGEFFTTKRVVEVLNECDDESPKECIDRMNQRSDEFVGDAERFDDLTMLAFKYLGR